MEADQDTPRSRGDTSVDSSSSAYFKRRFDGKKTRREALEQRFGKGKSPRNYLSPSSSSTLTQDILSGPQIPDTLSMDEKTINSSSKMLAPRTTKIALDATDSSLGMRNKSLFMDDFDDGPEPCNDSVEHTSQPQHLSTKKYYRVIYRGVISLLSDPELSSPRSGVYLSYGEIVESSQEIVAAKSPNTDTPATPTRKQASNITESLESEIEVGGKSRMIRVDRVLTGGYTVDAVDAPIVASDKTPKRGNIIPNSFIAVPSTMPVVAGVDDGMQLPMGYLLAENRKKPILERIESPPKCESGSFLYKVISSTPLRIYTGPSFDAPTTKGMLVPGTSHEISLRVTEGSVSYLRLTRRQGWVRDRNLQRNGRISDVIVMKDVTVQETTSDCNTSVMSMVAASIATPVPPASGRHRAPRRQRVHTIKKDTIESSAVPRHVSGPVAQSLPQSRTASYDFDVPGLPTHDRAIMSPPSNISLLSDDSSLENSSSQRATEILTPDRSVARSGVSSGQDIPELPSFFLMRVNAPRGLKILDAPHFQVNNLIHGKNTGGGLIAPSPSKDSSIKSSSQSIFQTMSGGHHTTTLTSKAGNPAIFDSNTKSRKLPRGSVFEASKRMEASSAFNQGAGLIKLSDNSGWAIVPKREELEEQYRNVSGALAGIKEGEASRAIDEVGNAIVGDHQSPVYIRIHTRTGLSVSLPPNPALDDDVTSPSSSAGGTSSVISAGNASSLVRGQDSDVASSVGSSFLDSMFRTPRRKGRDSDESEKNRRELGNPPKAPTAPDKTPFSNILPCGAYVEVDRWAKAQDGDRCVTEYARLRGGQGWIPRSLNGKPITEIISPPEVRFGSYWFRVQDTDGIKVRLGPSRRAPSIKSEDGVYFRFECGEYLRASEIVTFFRQNVPSESYAKLYRNRHIRLYAGHGEIRPLSSLTVQAEWVQVSSQDESYLEECTVEPRIERHRQGWRYNVVLEARIQVRKGPSFESEVNGVVLLGGESILINERVTGPDTTITWLRLKDGQGWVHNVDEDGETLMIPHSIRHRNGPLGRPTKPGRPEQEDIAYNAIIARLFHSSGDLQRQDGPSSVPQSRQRKRWT